MVLLWQSSAFCCDWGSFPNTPGSGISHAQSAQLQRTRWTITVTALIFSEFWNPNTVSAALRLRDVCDIQLQSHGNLKRTKSFTPCSSPTETSFPLPSASSFSVQRSKSDLRKYENQKRIIQYLPYLNPEIVIQSRIFRAAHRPDDKQGKRKCHGNRKQPHNDSFCGKASFCSTFLQRNRSAGHKTNA